MPSVRPGGEFDYRFVVRDASSFWFHPHVRANEQIERGLYAPMVVEGDLVPDVAADRYLVLDDVKINSDGSLNEDTTELDRIYQSLDRLPAEDARILWLKHFDDRTFEAIARQLGQPAPTIKSRYYRALDKLRYWLAPTFQEPRS